MKRQKQCRDNCNFFGVCKGDCVSSAILEGSFDKIDNTTCKRAKKLLSAITKINTDVYSKYDKGEDIELMNPRALKIMKKTCNGEYDFIHNGK